MSQCKGERKEPSEVIFYCQKDEGHAGKHHFFQPELDEDQIDDRIRYKDALMKILYSPWSGKREKGIARTALDKTSES